MHTQQSSEREKLCIIYDSPVNRRHHYPAQSLNKMLSTLNFSVNRFSASVSNDVDSLSSY